MDTAITPPMESFAQGSSALIVGATGGIGRALTETLCANPRFDTVFATGRHPSGIEHSGVTPLTLDLMDEDSIASAVATASANQPLSLVVMATGFLHDEGQQPEKSWRSISAEAMARSFAINCTGPALIMKHVLPTLDRSERSVVAALSARVGSISDNRLGGWYAYRSAKAALNMIIKTASVELARTKPNACVMGLHPGTVDTALSKPFQANVPDGKLFDRSRAAHQLLRVLDGATAEQSGSVLDWRGHPVPA